MEFNNGGPRLYFPTSRMKKAFYTFQKQNSGIHGSTGCVGKGEAAVEEVGCPDGRNRGRWIGKILRR
jgi:hypothetical protein